jgi:hypothetical protein
MIGIKKSAIRRWLQAAIYLRLEGVALAKVMLPRTPTNRAPSEVLPSRVEERGKDLCDEIHAIAPGPKYARAFGDTLSSGVKAASPIFRVFLATNHSSADRS